MPEDMGSTERSSNFYGLSGALWRLAITVGIGQFSMSIWTWYFGVYMATFLEPWQMGLTFSAGTAASLAGYPLSGVVSDFIGRRKTLAFAFIPIIMGLFLLMQIQEWPYIPFFYGLIFFGWSFVLITSRAAPADLIVAEGGVDSAKRFTMVLMPAFLVDGLSPALASFLLSIGHNAGVLFMLGFFGACLSFIFVFLFITETLGEDVKQKARSGSFFVFSGLNIDFLKIIVGMIGFYFAFNTAITYYGNLGTDSTGWGLDSSVFGYSWSVFSLSTTILILLASGFADKRTKTALQAAVVTNGVMLILMAYGTGMWLFLAYNAIWAFPVVLWIGAERALVSSTASEEAQGTALGLYQFFMSATNLFAAPFGALIWTTSGSLRTVYLISGVLGLLLSIIAIGMIHHIKYSEATKNL